MALVYLHSPAVMPLLNLSAWPRVYTFQAIILPRAADASCAVWTTMATSQLLPMLSGRKLSSLFQLAGRVPYTIACDTPAAT